MKEAWMLEHSTLTPGLSGKFLSNAWHGMPCLGFATSPFIIAATGSGEGDTLYRVLLTGDVSEGRSEGMYYGELEDTPVSRVCIEGEFYEHLHLVHTNELEVLFSVDANKLALAALRKFALDVIDKWSPTDVIMACLRDPDSKNYHVAQIEIVFMATELLGKITKGDFLRREFVPEALMKDLSWELQMRESDSAEISALYCAWEALQALGGKVNGQMIGNTALSSVRARIDDALWSRHKANSPGWLEEVDKKERYLLELVERMRLAS